MRVLLVSHLGHQYLASVVPAMERRGVTYEALSTIELKAHQKWLAKSKYVFDRSYLAAFRKAVDTFRPDLVHATGVRSVLTTTLAALRPYPNIAIVHERISAGGMNVLSPLDWTLFKHKRVTRIVMPSRAMLNNWMGNPFLRRMVVPGNCEVLHYAHDLPPAIDAEGKRALRRSLGLDEDAFIIGTCCFIRPWKNVEFVAKAVASMTAMRPVCFAVIGPPSPDAAYMERIRAAGGSRLKLLGSIPNAGRIMGVFDLYVTPTALPGESFGVAFIEAMAHGVPSITMNFGASAELCEHGISGYALPPDEAAWRSVMEMLMADPVKREAVGRAARAHVAANFAPDVVAENYLSVYHRAIENVRRTT